MSPTARTATPAPPRRTTARSATPRVFDPATGRPAQAVNPLFATNPDTPAPGKSLYRFSNGHGGLQCCACHGSTHAEFPAAHRNDNIQSLQIQGHAGVVADCIACHASQPSTVTGGPHGMHPAGQSWIASHKSQRQRAPTAKPATARTIAARFCPGCSPTAHSRSPTTARRTL